MDRRAFLRGAAASLTALGIYGFKPEAPSTAADDEIECALDPDPHQHEMGPDEMLYVGGPRDGEPGQRMSAHQVGVVSYVTGGELHMHQYHPLPELGIVCWVGSSSLERGPGLFGPASSDPWTAGRGLWTPKLAAEAWTAVFEPIQLANDNLLMRGGLGVNDGAVRSFTYSGAASQ